MPKKVRTRYYRALPFLITYKPPCIVKIETVYYHDPDLKKVLPTLKMAFPKEVSITYDEITDRFDYHRWINIDWSPFKDMWTDHRQELFDRILIPLRVYSKTCSHHYPCVCRKKRL